MSNTSRTIATARLQLVPVQPHHQEFVFRGLSRPDMIQYYGISYATYEDTAEQMQWYAMLEREGKGQWWMIELLEQPGLLIGAVGFSGIDAKHRKGDMGYWLFPEFQHHGYMREAVQAALGFGFENFNLHRVTLEIETENAPSLSLARALKFRYEGTLRDCEVKDGRYISLDVYSMLDDEFHD